MAAPGSSAPRKFSEKIALQRQRQAEETAAFVEVMADLSSARVQVQKLRMGHMRGSCYGGSLPNVNQIGSNSTDFQGPPQSPLDPSRSTRHHGLVERVHRDPRRMMSPLRRHMRQMESSPYTAPFLSPHQEISWRRNAPWGTHPSDSAQLFRLSSALNRTNSDSALHTSVMNPSSQEPYPPGPQGVPTPSRRSAFPFTAPAIEEAQSDGAHLLKPFDAKKPPSASGRPKSCEVPGINIYPSADPPPSVPPVTSVLNTGGSLPDLTNLHFPSPLHTPLDPEESGFGSLSGGSSTGNLTSTMTHLGISRSGLHPAFDSPGFSSDLQTSLSRQSLQSSLSNPNLQTSLWSTSLQTSFSNPSLQSSLSSQSLPSSLSNHSLSPSASSHSLTSAYSTPSSPSSSSSSFPPMTTASLNTSPHRRVPLSPLTLPMAGDGRRPHQKQFSPTMSPTLTSITQGVPLDTSKISSDQRLPPYHFNHPNLLHQAAQQMSQQPLHQSAQPMANSHPSPQGMVNAQQHLHQPPQGMANSQQHLHQPPQGAGSFQQHLHQSPQGMANSQQYLHQHPQGMANSQQHLHQPPQGMANSQQHLHQHPQGMANSQQHLHQHPQGMANSQQHLHQHPQGMGNSHQHLHQSSQPVPQSQQPYHQSQNPLNHTHPTATQQSVPQSKQSLDQQFIRDPSQKALQQTSYKDLPGLQSDIQNFSYQQNSGGLPYPSFLGDYQLGNSLLSSLFDECDLALPAQRAGVLSPQYEQCDATENGRLGLAGDYPYSGGGAFKKQNSANPIPDIILTAVDSPPPGFSKEITSALCSVPGFEVDPSLGLEDDLNIEPLTLDGLNMLTDPYAPLTDPLVEDSFRSDRLQ